MKEIHKPKLTANMALVSDSAGNVSTSTNITTMELSMLNGIRGNVQTQLDTIAGDPAIASHVTDTNIHITAAERTAWTAKQDAVTGAASSILKDNLLPSRVVLTTASGKITSSTNITDDELNMLNNIRANVQAQIDNAIAAGALIGEVKWVAHNKDTGFYAAYLLCDGRAISRTEYADLFEVIGITWGGGDGSTTFNLPNLIGRTVWGATIAGEYKEAGLPNITGVLGSGTMRGQTSGAFSKHPTTTHDEYTGGGSENVSSAYFNASASNPIYGKSSTVQPPAATLRPMIRYKL